MQQEQIGGGVAKMRDSGCVVRGAHAVQAALLALCCSLSGTGGRFPKPASSMPCLDLGVILVDNDPK